MNEQNPAAAAQPPASPASHPSTAAGPAAGGPYAQAPAAGPYAQAPAAEPWAQHPSPPRKRSHVGLVVGSIVGGVLLLGVTFAGGAAVGWWAGAHHAPIVWSQNGPAYPGGPGGQGGPGQRHQGDPREDLPERQTESGS